VAVAAYVIQGGLRSTFIADYLHTVILFVAIFVFAFSIYTTNSYVGSPGRMYDLLVEASKLRPIVGNAGGSLLTFRSHFGGLFAGLVIFGGFSTVWLDQAYWQRAIASKPETSVKAYLLGGLAWYGIPFGFATAMGLGCAAMTGSPSFPTYPQPLTLAQNFGGFSSAATAIALMGRGGAALMLLLLFMAITSATSAELIAVSSLWTFDIYKLYGNKDATSPQLVRQSHFSISLYALVLGGFCCVLSYSGIDITWLITALGIIVGGGGIPLGLILLWPSRMSTAAATVAPLMAFPIGLTAWFVTTHTRSGAITVATTGDLTNALAGSACSCGSGVILAVILSYVFPKKYESNNPAHIARVNKISGVSSRIEGQEVQQPSITLKEPQTDTEPKSAIPDTHSRSAESDTTAPEITGNDVVDFLVSNHIEPLNMVEYKKAERLAVWFCVVFFVVAIIAFPLAFIGSGYIFSKAAFQGWVVVSLIWVFISAGLCILWPLWESRVELTEIALMVVRDVLHQKEVPVHAAV
jgi:Na+/proline symporter